MKSSLYERARMFLQAHHKKSIWYRIVSVLAVCVVFVTTYMLVLPAITMERPTICGMQEHYHTAECYSSQYSFICGGDEAAGHEHTDDCLMEVSVLTCTLPEHYHVDSCYAQDEEQGGAAEFIGNADDELIIDNTPEQQEFPELSFLEDENGSSDGQNDGVVMESESETETETETETDNTVYYCGREAHVHSAECFDENNNRICGKETHEHTEKCLTLPENETETETETQTTEATETETETMTAAETEDESESESETASETETAETETESASEAETESETETTQQPQMNSWGGFEGPGFEDNGVFVSGENQKESDAETEAESAGETESEAETESKTETEPQYICGLVEHVHTEECYNPMEELVCGLEEHTHTEDCLAAAESESEAESASESETASETETVETETESASEVETESESETETEPQYICGLEEHTHTEACYDEAGNLVCDLEEHTHTEACTTTNIITNLISGDETEENPGIDDSNVRSSEAGDNKGNDLMKYVESVVVAPESATTYDPKTNVFNTTFDVNFKMKSQTVVDNEYHFYLDVPEGIIVPADLMGKTFPGRDSDGVTGFDFTFKEKEGKPYIEIVFRDSYINDKAGDSIECTIEFSGKLSASKHESDGDIVVDFSDNVKLHIDAGEITYTENETYDYDIHVEKAGSYIAENGKVQFIVKVYSVRGTPGPVILDDILKDRAGLTLSNPQIVSVTEQTYQRWVGGPGGNIDSYGFPNDSSANDLEEGDYTVTQNPFKVTLPQVTGCTREPGNNDTITYTGKIYTVIYEYDVTDIPEGTSIVKNEVTAESKNGDGGDTVKQSAEGQATVTKETLSKAASYDQEKETIKWTITVNQSENNIAGARLTDDMFAEKKVKASEISIIPEDGYQLNTDSEGYVLSIDFIELDGSGSNTQQYTITYETNEPRKWEDCLVDNEATLDPTPDNSGDGDEYSAGASQNVPGKGGIQKLLINKETAAPSEETGLTELEWKVILNAPDGGIPAGTEFEDAIKDTSGWYSDSHYTTLEQIETWAQYIGKTADEITEESLKWLSYVDEGSLQLRVGQDFKEYKDAIASNDKFTGFKFRFKEDVPGPQNYVLTYKTFANIEKCLDEGSYTFSNEAKVGNKASSDVYTFVRRTDVIKTDGNGGRGTTDTTSEDGIVTWKVKVNLNGDYNTLTVTDNLPVNLVDGTVDVTLLELCFGGEYNQIQATIDENGEITAVHDSLVITGKYDSETGKVVLTVTLKDNANRPDFFTNGRSFNVTYKCQISDSELPATPGETKTYTLKNDVEVTVDNKDFGADTQTQEHTVTIPEEKIKYMEKSGEYDNNAHALFYTVDINLRGEDLLENGDRLTLEDILQFSAGGTSYDISLLQDSVKLYYAEVDIDGTPKLTDDGRLIASRKEVEDWSWRLDTKLEYGKTYSTITADIPDGVALVLKYEYTVEVVYPKEWSSANISADNTASLKGISEASAGDNTYDQWSEVGASGHIKTGKKTYSFIKVDSENYGKVIGGAKFALYMYDPEHYNPSVADKYGEEGYVRTTQTYVTDSKGRFSVSWQADGSDSDYQFEVNRAYYVVETEAPEGYDLPDIVEKYYFHFSDAAVADRNYPEVVVTGDTIPDDIGEKFTLSGGIDLSKTPHTVYCVNVKKSFVYEFEKVDNEDNQKKLNGAVFTVYKYNGTEFEETDIKYTTDVEGRFSIKWDETKYQRNTAYYVVETKAPIGYEVPKSPELYYFHFADEDTEKYPCKYPNEITIPQQYTATGAKDLNAMFASETVTNKKEPTSLTVQKVWQDKLGNPTTGVSPSIEVKLMQVATPISSSTEPKNYTISAKVQKTQYVQDYWELEQLIPEGATAIVSLDNTWAKKGGGYDAALIGNFNSVIYNGGSPEITISYYGSENFITINLIFKDIHNNINIGGYLGCGNATDWKNPRIEVQKEEPKPVDPVEPTVKVYGTYTLSAPEWSKTFEDLPKEGSENGVPVEYSYYVEEIVPEGANYHQVSINNNEGITHGTITICNEVDETFTDVTVNKLWQNIRGESVDAGEESISVTLYDSNDQKIVRNDNPVTLSQENGWSYTWNNLPEGTYYVKEDENLENKYSVTYSNDTQSSQTAKEVMVTGGKVTITNKSTEIAVQKVWQDRNGQPLSAEELAKKSIEVQLWKKDAGANTQLVDKTVTLPGAADTLNSTVDGVYSSDGWGFTWKNLPQGEYYVVETLTGEDGHHYEVTYFNGAGTPNSDPKAVTTTDGTITITNKQDDTDIAVEKKWIGIDGNEKITDLPESIQVQLYKVTAEEPGSVPVNDKGEPVSEEGGSPVTLNVGNSWKYEWKNLLKGSYFVKEILTDELNGKYDVTYSVEGKDVSGEEEMTASSAVESGTITITNTEKHTEITVKKVWKGPNGTANWKLPEDGITVKLYRKAVEGEEDTLVDTVTLTAVGTKHGEDTISSEGWQHTWENLPLGEYYVVEDPALASYIVTYENDAESTSGAASADKSDPKDAATESGTITITNTEDSKEFEVKKEWENVEASKQSGITVQLYRSHTKPESAASAAGINTVSNARAASVAMEGPDFEGSMTSITLRVGYWLNGSNEYVQRPAAGWIRMVVWQCDANGNIIGSNPVARGTLSYENQWSVTIGNLPGDAVIDGKLQKLSYLVQYEAGGAGNSIERAVLMNNLDSGGCLVSSANRSNELTLSAIIGEGYGASSIANIRTTAAGGASADLPSDAEPVRTISSPLTTINGSVTGDSPEGSNAGEPAEGDAGKVTLTAEDGWYHKWENLPKKDADGSEWYYYAKEVKVPDGFEASYSYDGENKVTITNTKVVDVTVTKIWSEEFTKAGINPNKEFEVKVMLYNGREKVEPTKTQPNPVTLNSTNNWTYTWKGLPPGEYSVAEQGVYKTETGNETVTGEDRFTYCTPEYGDPTKDTNGNVTLSITNNYEKPYVLPETGGPGTLPYTVGGALLTAFATLLLYIQNKRRKEGQGTS